MIVDTKKESGQLRPLVHLTDNTWQPSKKPARYFDVALDFRWKRASPIIPPSGIPEQNQLSMRVLAAEELTEEEFTAKMEEQAAEDLLRIAKQLINPTK